MLENCFKKLLPKYDTITTVEHNWPCQLTYEVKITVLVTSKKTISTFVGDQVECKYSPTRYLPKRQPAAKIPQGLNISDQITVLVASNGPNSTSIEDQVKYVGKLLYKVITKVQQNHNYSGAHLAKPIDL